jgi:hypothetical protein
VRDPELRDPNVRDPNRRDPDLRDPDLRDPDLERQFEDDEDDEPFIEDTDGGLGGVRDVEATFRDEPLFGEPDTEPDDDGVFGI